MYGTLLYYSLNIQKTGTQYIIGRYNNKQYKQQFLDHNILSCMDMCHYHLHMNEKNLMDMMCNNLQYCCMLNKKHCNLLLHNPHWLENFTHIHPYSCMFLPNYHKFLLKYTLSSLNLNYQCMLNKQRHKVDKFRLHQTHLVNIPMSIRPKKTIKQPIVNA